jgi:hypothetical protein
MSEIVAWEAIRRVITDLPTLIQGGHNLRGRSSLAWADTLAGLSICAAGTILPHGIAMAIGGMYPGRGPRRSARQYLSGVYEVFPAIRDTPVCEARAGSGYFTPSGR